MNNLRHEKPDLIPAPSTNGHVPRITIPIRLSLESRPEWANSIGNQKPTPEIRKHATHHPSASWRDLGEASETGFASAGADTAEALEVRDCWSKEHTAASS